MGHIVESIAIDASARDIWDYVQDVRRRLEWDVTVARFELIDAERADKGVRVLIRAAGGAPIEYEAVYIAFKPYTVSAIDLTRSIGMRFFTHAAGSWRYRPLEDGGTEFTITFDYAIRGGSIGRIVDRLIIEPAIGRKTRRSLNNLRQRMSG